MDNIFIIYLIKVSAALAMFYALYMLCLRKDTFIKIRRFFFLFAIFFSLVFPFIKIQLSNQADTQLQIPSYWLSDIEFGQIVIQPAAESTISMWNIIPFVLIFFSIILGFRFIIQLLSILKLKTRHETEDLQTCKIIKIKDEKTSPFSFFKWIFVSSNKYGEEELDEIIAHEQVHVRQFHSIDVILFEILCICFWWNPFAWLLKKEMKINLEYLADEGVLEAGFDSKEYQYILLQVSNKSTGIPLINNFNVSQLKKRITMMNKKKTFTGKATKYLLAVPVVLVLLLGNAAQATPTELINSLVEETTFEGNQSPQKKGDIFTTVEQMPQFSGGEQEMLKFIAQNLKYPVEAQKSGIQGRVTIRFVVTKTGTISDIQVIRGIDPSCDKEAARVIKLMPKWNPGKQNGKEVDVFFTLPIIFKLSGGSKKIEPSSDKNEVAAVGYGTNSPSSSNDKSYIMVTEGETDEGNARVAFVNQTDTKSTSKSKPFTTVEQMPGFPGGEQAMQQYIGNNLKYPVEAQKEGIQGRVTTRFIVGADGSISDVTVLRGVSPELDAEAVRVIRAMPNWSPGKQNSKAVPVYFTMPIVYRLKKDDPKTETPQ